MKRLVGLVFFLWGITLVTAQNSFKVSGIVNDFHDKTLLKDAKVKIGNFQVNTDDKGRFSFTKVNKGTYTLLAQHPKCEAFSKEIVVDKDLFLTINLEHHIEDIETVRLTGVRKPSGSIAIQSLNKAQISQKTTENLGNILANISGVTVLKTGNNITKPVIHGLYGSRINIINDGVKMAEQEWGVEHAPSIEITAFERINIVKGSGVLRYGGEAAGGVVILEPKVFPAKDTIMGEVSLSGISNGKGVKIGTNLAKTWLNRWFVRTAGTYQKLGDLYIPHHTLQNTGAEEQSFNFSFGNRNFKQGFEAAYSGIFQNFGIFTGSHLGGPEDYYKAINFGGSKVYFDNFSYNIRNPKQEVGHHIAKIEAYRRFYNLGKFSLAYSFQLNNRKEYDIRRGELSARPSLDLRLMTHQVKIENLLEREGWQLESGVSAALQDNYPNPATEARRLIPDYYRYDAGIFSVLHYKINNKLKGEVGVRYDFNRYDAYKYYDQSDWNNRFAALFPHFFVKSSGSRVLTRPMMDFHNISANVGLAYKPAEQTELRFNISKASRTPNPAELFADGLHHSAAIIERGDLSIKKEEVYNAQVSVKSHFNILKGLQLELNPYIMMSDSFINQVPTGIQNSNRGVFMIWDYEQTKARIFGLDADLELNLSDALKWNSEFSVLKGDDLAKDEPLILMMPSKFRNKLEFKLHKPNDFYITLENESALAQKRFPVRNVDLNLIENGEIVTKTLDISTPPKGYSVFHVSTGMDLLRNLNVNFRITNILNTDYREYLNRLRYFAPELGRNLILTFKYNF